MNEEKLVQPPRPLRRVYPPLHHRAEGLRRDGAHKRLIVEPVMGVWLGLYGDCTRIHGNAGIWGDCSAIEGKVSGIAGDVSGLRGDVSGIEGSVKCLYGDASRIRGDVSNLWGDLSGLAGDATGLEGECTGLEGNLDRISVQWRRRLRFVTHWVRSEADPALMAATAAKPQPEAADLPLFAALANENPAA